MKSKWPVIRLIFYTVELCTLLKLYLVEHKLLPEFTNDAPCHRWIKYCHCWFSSRSRDSRTEFVKHFYKLTCWFLNLDPITCFRVSEPFCLWFLVKNNFWNFLHCWLRLDNFQGIRSKCCPMECLSSFNIFVIASLHHQVYHPDTKSETPSTRSKN